MPLQVRKAKIGKRYSHRCRAEQRPPGSTCNPAPSRLLLMGARVRLRRRKSKGHPQESRRRYARWSFVGRSRPRWSSLPARSSHGNRSPRPLPSPCWRPGVGCSRCPQAVRRSRRPWLPPLPVAWAPSAASSRAPSIAAAWVGGAAPLVRLRRFVLRGATPTPPLSADFWVAGEGSEAPSGIDAPDRKSAAAGGSREASASGQPECSGVLRSCLTSQPASPGLAPLAPPHTGSPPAFARAPRPGLRRRVPVRSSPPHHASGPRSVAKSWECASGTSLVSAEVTGSRCRLRALSASSVVLVTPGASALVPRLCSLVAPAGTLDAAPSGGGRQLSFRLSPKQVGQLVGRGR